MSFLDARPCLVAILALGTTGAAVAAQQPSAIAPAGESTGAWSGYWTGAVTHRARVLQVSVDVPAAPDAPALVDYPEVPIHAAPFAWRIEGDALHLRRDPPGGPLSTLRLERKNGALRGVFSGAGAVDASIALERNPEAPARLRESDLRFANGSVRLAGTVVWPSGSGPFPAVVIAHGSGDGHRDQASYRSDAFRYARRGVAALIYDKRGSGESGGDWRRASMQDLADDALAGLRALQALEGIRDERIGVAGHSQGGWIAPLAATRSGQVAFVVATSASGIGPMAQSLFHNANDMRGAGFDDAAVEQAQALRRRLYLGVEAGEFDASLQHDLRAATALPWFAASQLPTPPIAPVSAGERALLLFDPLPVWRKVRVPVLAVWGSEDIHLPAAQSRDLIAAALREAGNEAVDLHVVEGLDHGFFPVRGDDADWDFPRGDARVERLLARWLERRSVL